MKVRKQLCRVGSLLPPLHVHVHVSVCVSMCVSFVSVYVRCVCAVCICVHECDVCECMYVIYGKCV